MKSMSNRWLPVLVVCMAMASPLWAIAQAEDPAASQLDGSRTLEKAFDYGLCALSIVTISSGFGAALAVLTCGKALNAWWTE